MDTVKDSRGSEPLIKSHESDDSSAIKSQREQDHLPEI